MSSATTRHLVRPLLAGTLAALLLLPASASVPASAAAPANDDIAEAIVLTTAPATVTVDTTEATADPEDGRCVGDRSVWFRLTADRDGRLEMTTAGSSFNTRLAVFRGPRSGLRLVECDRNNGPGGTSSERVRLSVGERYWIAVSSATLPGEGGTARLTIGRPVPPGVDITVDGAYSGVVSGRLVVYGTVACDTPSQLRIYGTASQRVTADSGLAAVARGQGRRGIRACWTEPVPWRVRFDSGTGWAFQPGPAAIDLSVNGWDGIDSFRHRVPTTNVVAVDDPEGRTGR